MDKVTAELGDLVSDTVTGFEGVATGKADYLTGCSQFLVTATTLVDGEVKTNWFDIQRLRILKKSAVKIDNGNTPGGPNPVPPDRMI